MAQDKITENSLS